MRFLCYRLLTAILIAVSIGTVARAQTNIQSNYLSTTSPYIYTAVSSVNSSTLVSLKGLTLSSGDLDQGFIQIQGAFSTSLNGGYISPLMRVYTNGLIQTPRSPGYYINYNNADANWFHQPGTLSGYYTNGAPMNMIFGFATDLDLSGSSADWFYALQGTAPNRRMVIEWRNAVLKGTSVTVTFQIIFNETSNAIDVVFGSASASLPSTGFDYYTGINEGTAAIGTVVPEKSFHNQSGNYIASRYTGTWIHTSTANPANAFNSTVFPANQGIRYCLKPTINVSAPAVTLFDGVNNVSDRTSVGVSISRTYTVSNLSSSSTPVKITTNITGIGAAHYSVTPSSVGLLAAGASQTFTVTFNPSAFGDLLATLTLNISTPDGAGCPFFLKPTDVELKGRALGLSAIAPLSIDFGAVALNSTSAKNVALFHNDASTALTYYFTGPNPSGAEFSISGAVGSPKTLTGTVIPGGTVSLPVTFSPSANGVQNANIAFHYTDQTGTVRSLEQSISVTGEGTPSRMKFSKGTSTAHVASGSLFAQSLFGAVGEEPLNLDFVLTNTGVGAPVRVRDFSFYDLDRENPIQGRLRVAWTQGFGKGEPIASNDFRVQQYLDGQWTTVTMGDIVEIPAQQARQMRVQFAPDRRGVNFVRMFFTTDATVDDEYKVIRALDVADREVVGLQSYDFYGITARNSRVESAQSLLFPPTEVGEFATASVVIANTGNARLLIEQKTLQLLDGDKDFRIESAFAGMEIDNGKYVIPVNQSGEVVISFTPKQGGTRLSMLHFVCNDSTEVHGVVGPRYIPITGVGSARAHIDVQSLSGGNPFALDTAIVAVPTTYKEANIRISNDGNSDLHLTEVLFEGSDVADYQLVAPFNPTTLKPNESITLAVRFSPQTGGTKRAEMLVHSNAINGVVRVRLEGFAGERLASASVSALFAEDSIAVGEKRSGVLVVRNTGTVDLEMASVAITGANQGDYTVESGSLPQTIAPLAFVSLPIEFNGNERGSKAAMITVMNNSTNEPTITAMLGGFVGVRTNTHTPESINVSSVLGTDGRYEEQRVCVDVTNTGDLPMTITAIQLTGAQADQYSHDGTVGMVIAPGTTEQICVTYRPTSSMTAVALLTVITNGAPGAIEVPINGVATGVGEETAFALGYRLEQSVPNPAREEATLHYVLPVSGTVSIELYDAVGKRVMTVVDGEYRGAGTHSVRVPVQQLESGAYVYRLTVNGYAMSKVLQVVK